MIITTNENLEIQSGNWKVSNEKLCGEKLTVFTAPDGSRFVGSLELQEFYGIKCVKINLASDGKCTAVRKQLSSDLQQMDDHDLGVH